MPGTAFALVGAFVTDRAFSATPPASSCWTICPTTPGCRGLGLGELVGHWFTPVAEVALCGHATLASAHRPWETGALPADAPAVFDTLTGRLTATRDGSRRGSAAPDRLTISSVACPGGHDEG